MQSVLSGIQVSLANQSSPVTEVPTSGLYSVCISRWLSAGALSYPEVAAKRVQTIRGALEVASCPFSRVSRLQVIHDILFLLEDRAVLLAGKLEEVIVLHAKRLLHIYGCCNDCNRLRQRVQRMLAKLVNADIGVSRLESPIKERILQ